MIIGFVLLFISAISVYGLLLRAITTPDVNGDEMNVGTLWALFLFGLSMGIFLLWIAL